MSFELRMEMELRLDEGKCRCAQIVQQQEARLLAHHRESLIFLAFFLPLLADLPRNS
jgi:hypothetical protein